jgi:hypothetical protein
MSVVFVPEARHSCGPNSYGVWPDHWWAAGGTVRECECGKAWVAYQDDRDPGYMGIKWRSEGWLERRRRAKRG